MTPALPGEREQVGSHRTDMDEILGPRNPSEASVSLAVLIRDVMSYVMFSLRNIHRLSPMSPRIAPMESMARCNIIDFSLQRIRGNVL